MLTRNREEEKESDSFTLRIGNVNCDIYPTPENFGKWYAAHASVQQLYSRDNHAVLREIRRVGLGEETSRVFYKAAERNKIISLGVLVAGFVAYNVLNLFEPGEEARNAATGCMISTLCSSSYFFIRAELAKSKVRKYLLR